MQHNQNLEYRESPESPRWNSWLRANIVLIAFLAIAGYYLITEHRAHVFGYLPFLLLLACPFLHMFMHRGHGGHEDAKPPAGKPGNDSAPPAPPAAGGHQH